MMNETEAYWFLIHLGDGSTYRSSDVNKKVEEIQSELEMLEMSNRELVEKLRE